MPEISNQNSTGYFKPQNSNNANSFGYDLQEEKKRIALGIEELKKEIQEEWLKKYANAEIFPPQVAAMHPEVVDFLLSFNLVSVYDNIAKQAGLDGKGRNILPQVIWQIAQTKNWDGLDQALESQLPLVHSVHMQVVQLLTQNIINKIKVLSEKPIIKKAAVSAEIKKEIQLPLAQALKQYPNIGEQNITNNPLKLKYFPTSVRPSIKNWITDFHDNMGGGKHGAVDRGNYLFHSENGKKLTPIERQKLSAVLKSLDEQTLLNIDPNSQTIIFSSSELTLSKQETVENKPKMAAKDNSHVAEDIFKKFSPADDNYFQVPKTQSPPGSRSYSPNFKNSSDHRVFSEQKTEKVNQDNFKDFSNTGGKLSFSSPQKFPVEKDSKTVERESVSNNQQKPPLVSSSQMDKISQTQKTPISRSQWTIKPSLYPDGTEYESEQPDQPKIKGNTVDLRN